MQKQRGMTLIGMLLTVAVVVIGAVFIMRIVPVYLQYYSIVDSVKSLNSTPLSSLSGDPISDSLVLKRDLNKRLDINGVDEMKDNEVIIYPAGPNKYRVKLKYQVIKTLVYNMSLLFDFEYEKEVVVGSEN